MGHLAKHVTGLFLILISYFLVVGMMAIYY